MPENKTMQAVGIVLVIALPVVTTIVATIKVRKQRKNDEASEPKTPLRERVGQKYSSLKKTKG